MSSFRPAGTERVNVFPVDDHYLFKHYFDDEAVFDRLKPYYNNQQYRFEVPRGEYDDLSDFLAEHGYGLVVVDVVSEFAVVVQRYRAHPDNIFKASVIQREVDGYNCFLMTDRDAVEAAVDEGATRLTASEFDSPF